MPRLQCATEIAIFFASKSQLLEISAEFIHCIASSNITVAIAIANTDTWGIFTLYAL